MIKQLLNSVIAKYCDMLLSRRSFIWSARQWQITILCPTIVNYLVAYECTGVTFDHAYFLNYLAAHEWTGVMFDHAYLKSNWCNNL